MKRLIVTACIVIAGLAFGIAALALFPGSNDSAVIVPVEPPPPSEASDSTPSQPAEGSQPGESDNTSEAGSSSGPAGEFQVPPGFTLDFQRPIDAPPADSTPTPEQQPPSPGPEADTPPQAAAEPVSPPAPTPVALATSASAAGTPEPVQQDRETGPLPEVPVNDLVENSEYGPLPKVAADGRRPLEVYARPSAYAGKAAAGGPARIAILIDGVVGSENASNEAIKGLPASFSVAYEAHGYNLQDLVTKARAEGHEVLLQIPLEPVDYPRSDPGPHTLLTTLPPEENMKRLQWMMSRFTGYVGVTNLMGAKFEATQDALLPVLEELKARGLIYLDDGTVQGSTAGQIASALGLDYASANVQIDTQSPSEIAKSLAKLESVAKERGAAIGVANAKPGAIKQLADWAGKLEAKGIVLVPVSAAVRSLRQS